MQKADSALSYVPISIHVCFFHVSTPSSSIGLREIALSSQIILSYVYHSFYGPMPSTLMDAVAHLHPDLPALSFVCCALFIIVMNFLYFLLYLF